MSKIKLGTKPVFTCTDGEEYYVLEKAESHQDYIDALGISERVEIFMHELFDIPTQEEIDKEFDRDNFDRGERLEEKRDEYLYKTCTGLLSNLEIAEVSDLFIEMWRSFGEDKVGKMFLFVKEQLGPRNKKPQFQGGMEKTK